MMDNYVQEAIKTESLDKFSVDHPRLLHAAIGISTEIAELLLAEDGDQQNLKEEFGDVLWYTALVADTFEVTFDELGSIADVDDLDDIDNIPLLLVENSATFLDHMKKVCFYGIELDQVVVGKAVANCIRLVEVAAWNEKEWTLGDLQEANIAKLRRRYGEKFTTEAAVNRNTAYEMEAVGT